MEDCKLVGETEILFLLKCSAYLSTRSVVLQLVSGWLVGWLCFWDRISLCSSGCLQTHDIPVSGSRMLAWQTSATNSALIPFFSNQPKKTMWAVIKFKMLYFRYTTHYYVEFKITACLLIFFDEQIRITDFQRANEYKSHSKLKREIKKRKGRRECFKVSREVIFLSRKSVLSIWLYSF